MRKLKEYEVIINGTPRTMQLSEEDAARYKNAKPKTKQTTPTNK